MYHSKRMQILILPSVACLLVPFFLQNLTNGTTYRKLCWIYELCILTSSITLFEIFLIIEIIEADVTVNVHRCFVKYTLCFAEFNET
jgi:hypothetical protein